MNNRLRFCICVSKKKWIWNFLWRDNHNKLNKYHTKYIEELEASVYAHTEHFTEWAKGFFTRDPVLTKFSQVSNIEKNELKYYFK